ncbi:MAG: hypothetical protein ACPL1B_10370, partial [Thermoprotei archaeon]
GSGSSGGGSGGSGGGTTATYLVYTDDKGGLYLVDPADPTKPIKINKDNPVNILREERAVSSGDLNTMQYKDLHVRAIYYVEGDKGPLMRLSLVKGSTLQPVQVSNLTNVCDVQESSEGIMIVRTVGQDGNCYTGGQYIVTSDMTSNSKPIDVTGKDVVTFVFGNDLKVKGAIIKDSKTLKFCNVDLSNCSQLAQGVTTVDDIASNNQKEYLCVDGKIKIFDPSTNTLSSPAAIDCKNISYDNKVSYDNDDRYVYYVDSGNIKKLDMNDVIAGWKTIYNSGDIDFIVGMTQDYLIAYTNNTTQLLAIKKDGSYKKEISDGNFFIATSNRLYFIKLKYTQDPGGSVNVNFKACYWDEGPNDPVCDTNGDSVWIGLSFDVNGTLNYSSHFKVYKLLKV